MLRVGFQFGLWSSVGKGALPPAHTPARSRSSLIQGQDDVVLQVGVIGAVGCKGDTWVMFGLWQRHSPRHRRWSPLPEAAAPRHRQSQHHQCSKPLQSSQEICTRAFFPCLKQRLKESSFSKCSSYELAGFSPDKVGRTPAESCLHSFLCTTKGNSSSCQGLDRCGSHSSQLDSATSLAPV